MLIGSYHTVAAAAVLVSLTHAQSYTDCNPLNKTCPADAGTTESHLHFDFTQSSGLDQWTITADNVTTSTNGAEFTINKQGDAATIQTDFYIFFGEVSISMKAASGTGIISSLVLESDDLDEVDWETFGNLADQLQTDYFGKGDTSSYDRWTWASISDAQDDYHTYTWTWTETELIWSIDNSTVRTLTYADAVNGTRYPQTPMRVRIGIWAGGDPDNSQGTIEWAGGETDYSDAPFTMYVKSVDIVNYNPATSYKYTDESGSYESIEIVGGNSNSTSSSSSTTSSSSSFSSSYSSPPYTNSATSSAISRTSTPTSSTTAASTSTSTSASVSVSSSTISWAPTFHNLNMGSCENTILHELSG
ncbi:concanavalin A-like lectin/glucanase [Aspergillus sclerotiicarbonarius CBS 121057]|uniref:Crh-like protein n=1 Tax=Aspergillus sclerotiicarbonarius (strain CBS 121057 / IBT 28362) TaxID=1448318 RepID=A0A319EC96_ASPSB|nr:concanavalin A-like lectin/glucanase [Aspergillus sclerotiicarbonarius CBS 121057]